MSLPPEEDHLEQTEIDDFTRPIPNEEIIEDVPLEIYDESEAHTE